MIAKLAGGKIPRVKDVLLLLLHDSGQTPDICSHIFNGQAWEDDSCWPKWMNAAASYHVNHSKEVQASFQTKCRWFTVKTVLLFVHAGFLGARFLMKPCFPEKSSFQPKTCMVHWWFTLLLNKFWEAALYSQPAFCLTIHPTYCFWPNEGGIWNQVFPSQPTLKISHPTSPSSTADSACLGRAGSSRLCLPSFFKLRMTEPQTSSKQKMHAIQLKEAPIFPMLLSDEAHPNWNYT